MTLPIRPNPKVAWPQAVTEYDFKVTYSGDLEACYELYALASEVPLSFSLAASTFETRSQVTVSATQFSQQLSTQAVLEHLSKVHEKAIALGLDRSARD